MARDIGPKIGIDGEAEFKRELAGIVQQAKTLDAEMRAVASSFDKEGESLKKNKQLTEQYDKAADAHREKIKKLEEAVEKSAKATGENSETTNRWKEILAKAKTELNNLDKELQSTTKQTSFFGDALKAAISKEVIMGGLNAIKDGMVAVTKAAAGFAKEVISAYADYEQLEGGIKKLFGETDWQAVTKNAQNAFKTAGLSANEYMETVTSFSASLINSLGGDTKKAADLADRAIRDMSDNANTFGTDMQTLQNAYKNFAKGQFTMLDSLSLGYGGTKTEMERLIKDAAQMTDIQQKLGYTIDESSLSFDNIVKAIAVMQEKMKIAGTTASEASGTISGSINSLKAAFQNFVIGLGADNADIDNLLQNVVMSFQDVVNNVQPIIERLIDYIPGIIGAVLPVLQSLAPQLMSTAVGLFNGFVSAIVSVLPDLVPVAVDGIMMFIDTILNNLPAIIDAGIQLVVHLIKGLADALPKLVEQAPMLISHFVSGIIKSLPDILAVGGMIIASLAKGIVNSFTGIFEAGWAVVDTIKGIFSEGSSWAKSWGADLIINFANGIIEHTKAVWESVKNVAQSIWNLLHFSEPDEGPLKNFSTYAPDMMKTFAEGIRKNQHLVTDAASQAMQGVSTAMTAGSATSNAYNFGGMNFTIVQQPGQSADELVDLLMYKMQSRIDDRKAVFAS